MELEIPVFSFEAVFRFSLVKAFPIRQVKPTSTALDISLDAMNSYRFDAFASLCRVFIYKADVVQNNLSHWLSSRNFLLAFLDLRSAFRGLGETQGQA